MDEKKQRAGRRFNKVITLKVRLTRSLRKIIQDREKYAARIEHFGVKTGLPIADWMLMLLETNECLPVKDKIVEKELLRLTVEEFPHSKVVQDAAKKGSMWLFRKYYHYGFYSYGLKPKRRSYEYDSLGRAWANRRLVKPQPKVWDAKQSVEAMRAEGCDILRSEEDTAEWEKQWARHCQRRSSRKSVRGSKVPGEPTGAEALRRSARASKKRRKASDRRAARKREAKRTYRAKHIGRGVGRGDSGSAKDGG